MPVSVEVRLETATFDLPTGFTIGFEDVFIRLYIRTEGHCTQVEGTLAKLWEGVTAFFPTPPKGNLRPSAKKTKRISRNQERRSAEAVGGRRQTGSGASKWAKGDGRVPGKFRFENKFTTAESFSMKLKDLQKLRAECEGLEQPVFEVEFQEKGTHRVLERWVLTPRKAWEKLVHEADND